MSPSSSPIIPVLADDEQMGLAAGQARQAFRFFWRELAWEKRRIIPGLEIAAVKAAFSDPSPNNANEGFQVEYMWMIDIDFDGRQLHGTLINSPHSLESFKEGQRVIVPCKRIVDWMYVIAGQVYGGYTVNVMRARMNPKERKQHDAAWGFEFGPVNAIQLVPSDFLTGKSKEKKGFLSRRNDSPRVPQDFMAVATCEHPMSVNMRDSLATAIKESPEMLTQANDFGFTLLHDLALAGSYDGVDVCLQQGATFNQKTNNGMTPLALAKFFGWQKVVDRLVQAGAVA